MTGQDQGDAVGTEVPLPARFMCKEDNCNTTVDCYSPEAVMAFFAEHEARHGTRGLFFEMWALQPSSAVAYQPVHLDPAWWAQ